MASIGHLIITGVDIMSTYVSSKTKKILATLGDVKNSIVESKDAEFLQTSGLVSRPPQASKGNSAAQATILRTGDRDIILSCTDLRGLELQGNMLDGETCLYAAGETGVAQGRVLLKSNGNVAVYTTKDNAVGGDSICISVNASDNSVTAVTPYGAIRLDSTGVSMVTANATPGGKGAGIKIGTDGDVSITGKTVTINAGTFSVPGACLLGTSAAPTPANAALHGTTGSGGVPSASVFIGL